MSCVARYLHSFPTRRASDLASSASVYGMAEEFPTTERQNPYDNRTLYGAAKAVNEGLLRSYNDMHGLDYVAFRYFNRSEEHTSELQSLRHLVCRLLLEKKKH